MKKFVNCSMYMIKSMIQFIVFCSVSHIFSLKWYIIHNIYTVLGHNDCFRLVFTYFSTCQPKKIKKNVCSQDSQIFTLCQEFWLPGLFSNEIYDSEFTFDGKTELKLQVMKIVADNLKLPLSMFCKPQCVTVNKDKLLWLCL